MSRGIPAKGAWNVVAQYALAVVAVVAATLLHKAISPSVEESLLFVTYFLSNAFIIGLTGLGPSICAIVLATLAADFFFMPPVGSFALSPAQMFACMVFVIGNLVILGLAQAMRRARFRAETNAQLALQQQQNLQQLLSDQQQTQATVRQQNTLLRGINRIFSEALSCHSEEELGRMCLQQAETVTASKMSFMGEFNPKTGLLEDIAISNPGWDACNIPEKVGHGATVPVNLTIHGIYGRVLKDGKSFFTNCPAAHPDRIGTPQGHPALNSFLGVPLIHEGKPIGIIAVANREGGYRQAELEALESIAAASVQALMRHRAEQAALRTAELNSTVEAVKAERQRFHDVLNKLPGYVALLTPDYQVPFANRVFLERFGDARGKRCYEHLFGRSEPCEVCETYKVLRTGERQNWEWLGPDGRYYSVFDYPFRDTDGSTLILEMGIDVTDRKQAEAEVAKYRYHLEEQVKHRTLQLQASNAQLRSEISERERVEISLREREQHLNAVFMASMDALVVIDDKGTFLDANPAAARLLATPIEILKGSRINTYLPNGFNFQETWKEFKERGRFEAVHDIVRPDGVRLTVEQHAVAEILPGRHLAVIHDITDRKRMIHALTKAKEDLRRHAEELEKLVKERTATLQDLVAEWEHFSYTISHDMRAPLRAMQGFAELMWESGCQGCADGTSKDFLHRIRKGANRLELMITDALEYTRAVQRRLELTPVDTGHLLRNIVQSYPNLQPSQADIMLEPNLPWVLGSESALTQCFSNLLGNAVKFVADGVRPKVRVWAEETNNLIRFSFEDNGIGIAKEEQGGLFRMFHRLSRTHEGTGIGLALVRKNVERMGGKVGLVSEPGIGSTFWVELRPASTLPETAESKR